MGEKYFTLTGTRFYLGNEFLEKGVEIRLEKEPDNEIDKESIMVKMDGLGKIGYVANSPRTVIGECMSAGRLYDKVDDISFGEVVAVTDFGIVCKVVNKEKKKNKRVY